MLSAQRAKNGLPMFLASGILLFPSQLPNLLDLKVGKFDTWVSIPATGDGDLRMRENVSWPLLFFKILENADGLTRKIRLNEEDGDDRRIREKDEGDDTDLCEREYEVSAVGDLWY